jgi:hypothetical protein
MSASPKADKTVSPARAEAARLRPTVAPGAGAAATNEAATAATAETAASGTSTRASTGATRPPAAARAPAARATTGTPWIR